MMNATSDPSIHMTCPKKGIKRIPQLPSPRPRRSSPRVPFPRGWDTPGEKRGLPPGVFLVQFDDSAQWLFCVSMGLHEGVNSMSEFPSGLLGDAQVLCQKDRRYTVTGIDHEVHGYEPGLQRQLGGMQRRPSDNCKLPMTSYTLIQSGSDRRP